jgi:thiaminase
MLMQPRDQSQIYLAYMLSHLGMKVTTLRFAFYFVIKFPIINETGMRMKSLRKKNSKRPFEPWIFYLQSTYRKIVETTGSMIERLLPKSIHSVTAQGFELKVGLFVLAANLNFLG